MAGPQVDLAAAAVEVAEVVGVVAAVLLLQVAVEGAADLLLHVRVEVVEELAAVVFLQLVESVVGEVVTDEMGEQLEFDLVVLVVDYYLRHRRRRPDLRQVVRAAERLED